MPAFNQVLVGLKDEIVQLAKQNFGQENLQAALQDGQDFLEQSKAKLEQWLIMLNNKEISKEEFKSLVGGVKELAEMQALTQAGAQAAKIDKFRTQAINLVIGAAFALIP